MKNAANSVIVLLATLVLATLARGAAQAREILAEGSADRLWVADVARADALSPSSGERTRVYSVAVPQDGWQRPMLIGAGTTDLAHRGTQLIALLKTGEWMFVWQDGRSSGPALPAQGEMVGIGGDGNTVWAIGRVAGGMRSVTTRSAATAVATTEPVAEVAGEETTSDAAAPASEPETATTREAMVTTAPATGPMKLVLFRLDRSTWVAGGELPDSLPASVERVSLAVVRDRLFVAAAVAGEAVVYERDEEKGWVESGRWRPGDTHVIRAKVLDGGDRPIVWAAGATGAGVLYFGNSHLSDRQWGKPVDLRVQSDLSQPLPRDVTVVAQRIRLAFARGEKLFLQSYDWRSGQPAGQLATVSLSTVGGADSRVGFWLNAVVMAVLLLVMVGAVRRRGEIEETVRHLDRIPLAPLTLRLAAGVVDFWPQWAAAVFLSMRADAPADFQTSLHDPTIARAGMIAFGVYILHTMVLEMLVGASVGKLVFGLRVVQLNGEPASMGSMFVRNILRAVDFGLVFVGVLMILMSPLRQRIGDLAAGTIVVRRTSKERVGSDEGAVNAPEE